MDKQLRYNDFAGFLTKQFPFKVQKLSVNAGFTCPNRDGSKGYGGCTYCNNQTFNPEYCRTEKTVTTQLEEGKLFFARKYPQMKYLAYFQAYTGTYAPVSYLRPIFEAAIEPEDVLALSVATRPDCLDDAVLDLLEELNAKKPVWVELGLQTIHPATAEYIRRGYPLSVYDAAVGRLKKRGLEVIVHVILGLPGETTDMMKETVSYVGVSGADGIKLQLLHILKGTDLEKEYEAGRCPVFSMEEYVGLVADCISLLPKDMVIHRMTGDGDKKTLLAPLWSADKKRVWNALQREIASR